MPGHEYPVPRVMAQNNLLPVGIEPGTSRLEVRVTNHNMVFCVYIERDFGGLHIMFMCMWEGDSETHKEAKSCKNYLKIKVKMTLTVWTTFLPCLIGTKVLIHGIPSFQIFTFIFSRATVNKYILRCHCLHNKTMSYRSAAYLHRHTAWQWWPTCSVQSQPYALWAHTAVPSMLPPAVRHTVQKLPSSATQSSWTSSHFKLSMQSVKFAILLLITIF